MEIANVQTRLQQQDEHVAGLLELDFHADTCCLGATCIIISYSDKVCEVSPFHPDCSAMKDVPVMQARTAYDDPHQTGITYILVINQGLYLENVLPNTLLNPKQVRSNSIVVDICPKHLAPDPRTATHSIYVPQHNLRIPLKMRSIFLCLPVHLPSVHKIETCQWVELTPQTEWDPHSNNFEEQDKLISDLYEFGASDPQKDERLIGQVAH